MNNIHIDKLLIAPPKGRIKPESIARMREIYAAVPKVNCKGLCAPACTNVPIMPLEALYLTRKHGAAVEMGRHRTKDFPTLGSNAPCQFLKDGRCSIYNDRPLICRMYGHDIPPVEGFRPLECTHGCTAETPFTVGEFLHLTAEMMLVSMGREAHEFTGEELYHAFERHMADLKFLGVTSEGEKLRMEVKWEFDDEETNGND